MGLLQIPMETNTFFIESPCSQLGKDRKGEPGMKAYMISEKNGKVTSGIINIEEPQLRGPKSVKVAVESIGICGTDLKIYTGHHSQSVGADRIPGHEFAGVVTEVGEAVSELKVGDRVVHEPISFCGRCYACRKGRGNVCSSVRVTGCNMEGGMEEYFVADEKQWHKIPDWMSWNEAALIEPYTVAAQTCVRAKLEKGDSMLIYGAGPIGLMLADTAVQMGAKVIISELADGRLELARKIGIQYVIDSKTEIVRQRVMEITDQEGPNIVCDCAGVPALSAEAIDILSPAGRFVPVAPVTFPLDSYKCMRKEIDISASRLQINQFIPVINRFAQYKQHADTMITDEFDFAQIEEAFQYANRREPQTGKVIIRFHRSPDVEEARA